MEHTTLSSLKDKVIAVLEQAGKYNRSLLTAPAAILWPDKERQWEGVLPELRAELPQLLTFGNYDPTKRSGPAIWLKCMLGGTIHTDGFSAEIPAIIYLPGVSKEELRSPETAAPQLQPIIPYAYTGTITTQYNGREWTVQSLMENKEDGLGLSLAKDRQTKEALLKALPALFNKRVAWPPTAIDAGYLHGLLFPNAIPSLLQWICKGEDFLQELGAGQKESFVPLCNTRFGFEPDYKNIISIIAKLGSHQGVWEEVWQHYAAAPAKYPEIIELLRAAKPEDLGTGLYTIPAESWPQSAESGEDELRELMLSLARKDAATCYTELQNAAKEYGYRLKWVWGELGYLPLAKSLQHLLRMTECCAEAIKTGSLDELEKYYVTTGAAADEAMRSAYACVKKEADKEAVTGIISVVYKPWLEKLALKFQELVTKNKLPQTAHVVTEADEVLLFVDAFRYELARAFMTRLEQSKYKVAIATAWSALPSLTPTAKPAVSPIVADINKHSIPNEFRPQLVNGKDLNTANFRSALEGRGYHYCSKPVDVIAGKKCWLEIGEIDKKGHTEGAGLVHCIPELFNQIAETLEVLFSKGIKAVKIVTDHGWLLLPGGLPKIELKKELVETRWGRCATIKSGATTDLLHLPWHWNQEVYIAYAPGISFFKAGESYAHGGLSLQECLTPVMTITQDQPIATARIVNVTWRRLLCTVQTEGVQDGFLVDIRTRLDDEKSSILDESIERGKPQPKPVKDGKATLLISDDYPLTAAHVILMDSSGRVLHHQMTTSEA